MQPPTFRQCLWEAVTKGLPMLAFFFFVMLLMIGALYLLAQGFVWLAVISLIAVAVLVLAVGQWMHARF